MRIRYVLSALALLATLLLVACGAGEPGEAATPRANGAATQPATADDGDAPAPTTTADAGAPGGDVAADGRAKIYFISTDW